jgi:NDP-sugar pyrophosphorylase family protein
MVISADMLFNCEWFDIGLIQRYFTSKQSAIACYYTLKEDESPTTRGIITVDPVTSRITSFLEKPQAGTTMIARSLCL